jgi:hypothetical protein
VLISIPAREVALSHLCLQMVPAVQLKEELYVLEAVLVTVALPPVGVARPMPIVVQVVKEAHAL